MSTRLCLSTAGTYSRRFPHFYRTATPDFCLCSSASVRCEYAAGAKLFESRQNFLSTVNGPSSSRALATHGKEAGSIQSHYTEWSGLQPWRLSETDNRRVWGHKGPTALVLLTKDPAQKAALTHHAWQKFRTGLLPVGQAEPPLRPARPSKPELVPPKQVPTPKQSPLPLSVYMLHNLAHVELNAVDLAWDTVARFSHLNLEEGFYADFARVADDESRHLSWCLQRLQELGYSYGDMVAHSILWDGAQASSGSLAGRLAVVPMSQEARGLDAGPRLAEKLVGCGDNRSAAIVSRIALEEKAHVAVGVSWFTQMAAALEEDPGTVYHHCITSLGQQEGLRPPYNHTARQEVGLQQHWYDRSLWPKEADPAPIKRPAILHEGKLDSEQDAKQPMMTRSALQSLKQRMATVLDVELCNAA